MQKKIHAIGLGITLLCLTIFSADIVAAEFGMTSDNSMHPDRGLVLIVHAMEVAIGGAIMMVAPRIQILHDPNEYERGKEVACIAGIGYFLWRHGLDNL